MKLFTLIAAVMAATLAGALTHPAAAQSGDPGPTRVAIVTLGEPGLDVIGPHVNAALLRNAMAVIPPADGPDVLVLRINSAGGMLAEAPRLSDLIHDDLKPKMRVVVWVDRALSAAALVALTTHEIVMTPGATLGAVVTTVKREGQTEAISGDDLSKALQVGAEVARRGKHNARIIRAMQMPEALSVDCSESGELTFRSDEAGAELVNPTGGILTLNATTAEKLGISLGTASTPAELMTLLGIDRWREVGTRADDEVRAARRNVGKALEEISRYRQTRERALRDVRGAQTPAERRDAMERAARADAEAGRLMNLWPNIREYVTGIDMASALSPLVPPSNPPQPVLIP